MSTKDKIIRFISPKYRELKIVMKPAYRKEIGGQTIVVPGHKIVFHDNRYETSDTAEIEFLRGHKNYGTHFTEVDPEELEERLSEEQETLEEREERIRQREEELEREEKKVTRKKASSSKAKSTKEKSKKAAY